jgi:hypothetical protein
MRFRPIVHNRCGRQIVSCRDGSDSANLPGMARGMGIFLVNPTNIGFSSLQNAEQF